VNSDLFKTFTIQKINEDAGANTLLDLSGFETLPAEIRILIWRQMFPGERIVTISGDWSKRLLGDDGDVLFEPMCQLVSHQPTDPWSRVTTASPVTMSICQESRQETKRHYLPLFLRIPGITPLYFSPQLDVLNLGDLSPHFPSFVKALRSSRENTKLQFAGLKTLLIGYQHWMYNLEEVAELLNVFSAAEEVVIKIPGGLLLRKTRPNRNFVEQARVESKQQLSKLKRHARQVAHPLLRLKVMAWGTLYDV
jgi:hypothetical protein